MHKIKGLSEHFVYFNDDVFLNRPIKPDYYFKGDLPCDINKETCYNVPIYTDTDRFGTYISMMADIGIINHNFRRWNTVCQSPKRWFGLHLGLKGLIMSGLLAKQRLFVGFSNYHLEQAFIKTVFSEVWEKEPKFMNASCTRFREEITANPYIFRYWQFAKNMFYPQKRRFGVFHLTGRDCIDKIEKAINNTSIASICLNDTSFCSDDDFDFINKHIEKILNQKYPNKSSFEI